MSGMESAGVTGPVEKVVALLGQIDKNAPGMADAVRGIGYGPDGLVRAEISTVGDLEALTIDATLAGSPMSVIAEHVLEAVRAAHADARRQRTWLGGSAASPDRAVLTRQLGDVAAEASRGLDRMLTSLAAVVAEADRR
jgi:hypothetical protein